MEVKTIKEIRDYHESIFLGLTLRQFIFSVIAIVVTVLLYFLLKPIVGTEMVSWMCILGAVPFAVIGFFSYHGMTAEKFFLNFIRTEIIEPHILLFKPNNYYYEAIKEKTNKKKRRSNLRC